jgi:hypothetical protein
MQKRHANIILGIVAVVVVCTVVLVAGGAWFAMSVFHPQEADEQAATAAFSTVRSQFGSTPPVFALRAGNPVLTRPLPASTRNDLRTLHILNWDPDQESLMRTDLPFALIRLKDGPIEVVDSEAGEPQGLSLRVSDIERFGPALLMDEELEDGHRLLIWTE